MKRQLFGLVLAIGCIITPPTSIAAEVTTPKKFFGFNMGDDYCLANYKQIAAYWKLLEKESDRVKLVKIGVTEEGRDHLMVIMSSPANLKNLARYQRIARETALAEALSEKDARTVSQEGKAIVWIDGGLHATETLCAQMLTETIHQFATAEDAESKRILDDCIILFVHANPDGNDLVADWYMKEKDVTKRTLTGLPRLYQKYVGHDNNRDFYANTQAETKNMNRVLYHEWFPHIVYNHHQSGPPGTVLFVPPFRDPANYFIDPLVLSQLDAVGASMMNRFLVENKPGATVRSGATYSTWYNGGLRTTTYYHNMIGLLSETVGNPTPMTIPYRPSLQLPKADYLAPIAPQKWHFRQSVDYSITANKGVLDYASRHREQLIYNIWLMGHNAIEKGKRDHWTTTPKIVKTAVDVAPKGKKAFAPAKDFNIYFRDPAFRDPRGYILPANQPDFPTATKFVNILLGTGVKVHRARGDFVVAGKKYPAGSYVVRSAQAFRAHVLDMFEPQDHPNDFAYPGAPPTPPYDAAGWTLAYQMAVKFDRVLDAFDGPFGEITGSVPMPPAKVRDEKGAVGFFLHMRSNNSFIAVNRLLKAGEEVRRLQTPFTGEGVKHPAGMYFIPRKDSTLPTLEKIAADLGTRFIGIKEAPGKEAAPLKAVRIGLWDKYGGSMPSGWTRWILEQFEYPYTVVMGPELEKGNLRDKFDVIILPDGAAVTGPAKQLKKFAEAGGTILAVGSSTGLALNFGLPIANHLEVEGEALPRTKYYVPYSVLQSRVNPAEPLAWGMSEHVDVMFNNSPTFKLPDDAAEKGIRKVAWFDTDTPLRSGWAWGQEHLERGATVVEAQVGNGKLALFGPQITFRAQPHGTFRFLFNGIVQAGVAK